MELNPSQENDIKHALRKHPNGIAFDQLFDATALFVEKRDLSGAIFRMTQQASIYKRGNLFYLSESAPGGVPPAREETPAPYVKPAAVKPAKPTPAATIARAIEKLPAAKPEAILSAKSKVPNGTLRRSATSGMAALTLYRYRDEDYAIPVSRIIACMPKAVSNIYSALVLLCDRGYAKRHGSGRDTVYKWTGKYNYPFPTVEEADSVSVKILPKSERDSTLALSVLPSAISTLETSTQDDGLPGTSVAAVLVTDKDDDSLPNTIVGVATPLMTSPGVSICEGSYPVGSNGNCCVGHEITPSNPAHAAITAIDQKIAVHQAHVDFLKDLRITLLAALSTTSIPV